MANSQMPEKVAEAGNAADEPVEVMTAKPEPSWFPSSYKASTPEENADRYRMLRVDGRNSGRPETLDEAIRRNFDADDARLQRERRGAPMPARLQATARRREEDAADAVGEEQQRQGQRSSAPSGRATIYVVAGMAAALTGGLIGYAASYADQIGASARQLAGLSTPPVQTAAPIAPKETTIAKKTITTATLKVEDVSGSLNSMIPLMLRAEPAEGGSDLILKISGLPQSAYLTAGTKSEDNAWQLAAKEAGDVKLVVPQTAAPRFDVAVAAFESNTGELAAPVKEITVAINDAEVQIAPANAPPETATIKADAVAASPVPVPMEQQTVSVETRNLAAKGDILLQSGDLAMARQFYEQAFAQGFTDAAFGAGKTYDPLVHAALKVQGLKAEPARALEWYMRASAAGNTQAAAAIEALRTAAP